MKFLLCSDHGRTRIIEKFYRKIIAVVLPPGLAFKIRDGIGEIGSDALLL